MDKDLKDLIDSLDSANKAHSELETMIKYLKEEVQRLNFTINEQKQIIKEQGTNLSKRDNSGLPQDVLELRELVLTQKQDIMKKDKDIEILQKTLEDLSLDLEKAEKYEEEDEELIYAKKTIVQLTEENEILKHSIENLQKEISELKDNLEMDINETIDEDQELIDAKKIIFQLTEETGLNKVKIESLRLQNEEINLCLEEQNQICTNLRSELEESEKLIDLLTYDNDNLYEKVNYLQQQVTEPIQKTSEEIPITTESVNIEALQKELRKTEAEISELKDIINSNIKFIESLEQKNLTLETNLQGELNTFEQKINDFTKVISEKDQLLEQHYLKYKKMEDANKKLSDLIVELRMTNQSVSKPPDTEVKTKGIYIDKIPIPLFFKLYNKLDEESKIYIIEQLLEDLRSKERDLKIYAIKILSIIKGKKILDALLNLKDDKDWIVKLYLIKYLSNFDSPDIENTLKLLQKDEDTDVREAATELLLKMYQN